MLCRCAIDSRVTGHHTGSSHRVIGIKTGNSANGWQRNGLREQRQQWCRYLSLRRRECNSRCIRAGRTLLLRYVCIQQQTRWGEPRGTDHLQTLQSHVESQSRREPWPQLQAWTPPRFVRCALYRTHWLHLVGQNIRGHMNIKLAKNELSSNIHLP